MDLKQKLAKIKSKIKNNPDYYIPVAIAFTTGTIATIATAISIKTSAESGVHVLLADDEAVRLAKEGRPIQFKNVDGEWYFKNVNPDD